MLLRACGSYRALPHNFWTVLTSMCPTSQQPCLGLSTVGMQELASPRGCASQPSISRGACSQATPPAPQAAAAVPHVAPYGYPSWSSTCCHSQPDQELQPQMLRSKSAKRKAAEALLAARYGGAAAAGASCPMAPPRVHQQPSISSNPLPGGNTTAIDNQCNPALVAAAAAAAAGVVAPQQHPAPRVPFTPQPLEAAGLQEALQPNPKRRCSSLAASPVTEGAASADAASSRLWGSASGQQDAPKGPTGAEERGSAGLGVDSSSSSTSSVVADNKVRGSSRGSNAALVAVPACPPDCSHPLANAWCHFEVQVPHVDWHQVTSGSPAGMAGFRIADGYEQLTLPGGLQVLLVENAAYVAPAIQALRASMSDSVISIDLEWRPEFNGNFTPVALLQLASSRMAVLIRTCRMGFQLHPAVKSFLQDPAVSLLGCGWGGADEQKMQRTFSLGQKQLGGVLDIQQIARGMGYNLLGLANLSRCVLGVHLPKSKRVSMSNWETRALSRMQVQYAALDVFLAGQVFRGLRLWHTCQEPCATCRQMLGAVLLGRPATSPTSSSSGGDNTAPGSNSSSSGQAEGAGPHQEGVVAATGALSAAGPAAPAAAAAAPSKINSPGKGHTCPACGRRALEVQQHNLQPLASPQQTHS